ncbi:MAG: chorismate mutase [Actinobacteria bacterium]|nr:chorismate mutase [Actinomycetota bacterium]
MPRSVRALRGATTFEIDEVSHVGERVVEMVSLMLERNDVDHDDLISIIFTATDDLTCTFPATPARRLGLGDVPLICARELSIDGAMTKCIRVLMHLETERSRTEMRHVYLHGAKALRDDLPE